MNMKINLNDTLMQILIVVVIIFSIYLFIDLSKRNNRNKENFIVLQEEVDVPDRCPKYLYTDGRHFYLHNPYYPLDGVKNPMKFDTLQDAENVWKEMKCPRIPYVDLVVKKNNKSEDDPWESYERTCNKHIAPNDHKYDLLMNSSKTLKEYRGYQAEIDNDQKNFELETCMIDRIKKENPELVDDNKFEYLNPNYNDKYATW